ncbi:glycosyltransferase [Thalassotalea euphylliae]|uniref:Glycosyltransferase n=1 Tax=Thalassotalea euphylliae TaxID=1655234 RepID=A0A3E0U1F2_9GAMM|nr:glycosyltransferase [Thalassotalea euphylliae]REL30427.1 glycosyltransferase [Thalassotalea euphylliae]
MSLIAICVLVGHFILLLVLSLFGLHRLSMVFRRHKYRDKKPQITQKFDTLPSITVQIPLYNERLVAKRIVDAVADFDYPQDKLQIQIVDDSNDSTSDVIAERVGYHQQRGINIDHVQRTNRHGYKAGALKDAMETATGEFIAIFDADFLPEPDLLKNNIHYFYEDDIAMVQFRWEHLNKASSELTQTQAIMLDAHFSLEQQVRSASNKLFNFNGTAGIWRTKAIVDSGHWSADTLTEDLDLSYRAQLKGWRMLYLNDVGCAGEIPADINAFKSQQHRWAKGGVEVMLKMLPKVWCSSLPLKTKVEASFHLSNNLAYLIMLIDTLVFLIPTLWIRQAYDLYDVLWLDLPLLFLASASHLIYLFYGQVALGHSKLRAALRLPRLMLLGIQLATNNAKAGYEALRGERSEFVRTPKSGELVEGDEQQLSHTPTPETKAAKSNILSAKLYRAVAPRGALFEFAVAVVYGFVLIWAIANDHWFMAPFLLLLLLGFLTTSIHSMRSYQNHQQE